VPNQGTPKEDLKALLNAIARVYASTINPDALLYRRNKELQDYDERMAILIMVVEGEQFKDYYLPDLAGVAFSRNLYRWAPQIRREDGFVRLVWGLGTRAVDRVGNDYPRLIALSHPLLRPTPDQRTMERCSQQFVDLIDMKENAFMTLPIHDVLDPDYPDLRYIAQVSDEGYFSSLHSRLMENDREKLVLTFEDLLRSSDFAANMRQILAVLERCYEYPVDMEFTVDIQGKNGGKPDLGYTLLQCRPQSQLAEGKEVSIPGHLPEHDLILQTRYMVPQGLIDAIEYVAFVPPAEYFRLNMGERNELARTVGRVNRALKGKRFILVGPGRWGSTNADPYLSGGARDGYYAFEWGNALFVMLDNFWYSWQGVSKSKDPWDWTLGRQQYDWLKRTLETSRARIKLVFAHHLVGGLPGSNTDARGGLECARYAEWGGYNTNGTWGFTDRRPGWPMPIQDLLLTNGVSAFFHGHDHLFVKQDLDANGDGRPELIYQECPQPSRQYGNFGPTNSAAGYGYTNGVIQGSSGYLRVQVTPTNAVVDYVRVFLPENEGVGRTNRMVTYSYTIEPPVPVAGFIASPTTGGAPLETAFADTSFGAITNRLWSFGDGAIASTGATNLAHTYGIPGTNIVRLIVSGPLGASTNAGTIIATSVDTIGDGIPNWWRALYFGGNGSTTNALSSASGDPTGGGMNNLDKYTADLDPTNRASLLQFLSISVVTSDVRLVWIGGTKAWQYLECSPELTSNSWKAIFTNTPPTPVTNTVIDPGAVDEGSLFYRIRALR